MDDFIGETKNASIGSIIRAFGVYHGRGEVASLQGCYFSHCILYCMQKKVL